MRDLVYEHKQMKTEIARLRAALERVVLRWRSAPSHSMTDVAADMHDIAREALAGAAETQEAGQK